MDPNTFPTKGNLILAKNSLVLSRQGYELMDKKRNILIRELMDLIDQAKDIQSQIDQTFRAAYAALQKANMEIGIAFVEQIAYTGPYRKLYPHQNAKRYGHGNSSGGIRPPDQQQAHLCLLQHQSFSG